MTAQLKNIIVFGANGQTGLQILKKSITEELGVTAFVRNPAKIPENIREKLQKVIQGDVFDKEKVEDAIQGHDAVLSALGDGISIGGKGTVNQGCQNILDGMKKHQVKKLVTVATALWLPDQSGLFVNLAKKLGSVKDHAKRVNILENETEIDWILMMPPHIKNISTVNPNYKVQKDALPGVTTVTSAELADFMIRVIMDDNKFDQYKHSKVGISSQIKAT